MKTVDFLGVPLAVGDYVIRAVHAGQSAITVELCRVVSFGTWKDHGTVVPGVVLAYKPSWGGVRHTGMVKYPDRLVMIPPQSVPLGRKFDYEQEQTD